MQLKSFAVFLVLFLCGVTASGQQRGGRITVDLQNVTLSEAISAIEKESGYTFFYDAKQTDLSAKVSLKADDMPLEDAVRTMLSSMGGGDNI